LGLFSTQFQHFFGQFWRFSTNLRLSLAFFVLASKYQFLWFTPACHISNQIQREFLFNVRIATRAAFLASSPPRQKTNFYKPRRAVNLAAESEICNCCKMEIGDKLTLEKRYIRILLTPLHNKAVTNPFGFASRLIG
jgi:hypothetical protein